MAVEQPLDACQLPSEPAILPHFCQEHQQALLIHDCCSQITETGAIWAVNLKVLRDEGNRESSQPQIDDGEHEKHPGCILLFARNSHDRLHMACDRQN
jgi:hypothetical protein